ncbi:thiamine-phosphate synthase family protein [Halobaculum roseum]|uniref:Thiamine-phosphate synthase family protein n=1 Tax=Halobaculum roseum TaxID=2175149 RepID=A0ABD5MJA8_9EURY|nr:thiamine-phosphate synthase family protein [Halobaculum roseum]QZY04367.1 helix-turn-helix domain-containing protein [Halobaculum roseum]
MPFTLPSEIVVEDVLPTLRVELAAELQRYGLTQQEIADELGVTQAAVSTYVSEDTATDPRIAKHPRTRAAVERVAEGLATDELDGYEALADILDLVRALEDRGPICEIHETRMPEIAGLGCDLCVRGVDPSVRAERAALADVRSAARTLSTTPGMAAFVPNVGSNIGAAPPDAETPTDVAAIPGRIYAVDGRVEVPANPEFGASRHVATVLLAAAAVDPDLRGAVNLATESAFLAAARERGIETMEFDADYEDRERRLRERFADRESAPRVLYHEGAFGIEPITYVLGANAEEAAQYAAELVEEITDA